MDAVLAAASARARALAERDWDAVAAQLHEQFRYVTANGRRLDRDGYLEFLVDGPVRWQA
jgi:hypothetical protein